MYSEELEKLIEFVLSDGELSDKERKMLLKRAEAEGIDIDEFYMDIEARLHDKGTAKSTQPRKSDKLGHLKKSSACGAIIQSFQTTYTIPQLKQLAKKGQISAITNVWKQGMANGNLACNVAELSHIYVTNTPPPMPML